MDIVSPVGASGRSCQGPRVTDADSSGPTTGVRAAPPRIQSLDALRGAGVLGMLAVHMQLFAYPSLSRWNPTAYGDLQGLNWWAWLVTSVLADGKFITIFAMLLGASIVMQPGQASAAGAARRAHVRRMAVLLLLGLLHAYLLWYGDMLVPLALCGALVFLARRLSPGWLLTLGGLAFASASALSFLLTSSTAGSDPAALAAWRAQWTPQPALIAAEIAQYRSGWAEQMAHRVPATLETQTWYFVSHLLWQMTGLMLIGMAFFKLGVLHAARSRTFYLTMGSLGFGAGTLLISLGLWRSFATNWDLLEYMLISQQLQYWGNLLVALGWTALVMRLVQLGWRLRILTTVGRMALTNYLLQTVICTTIFYGHGFGLFGRVDRAGQLAIVVGVWAFQWLASSVWLRYFAAGPVEWVVRWLVFGRRPGLLRSAPAVASV
jgi:uncharacterized protein